ncbi:hypothetical protein ABH923_000192 [Leifsonia sp. EB41]|uniref:SHOCT domain-containing protein n=1 Tax=Leifsonia sp. EB41 TaxID=3156260 RepID=UPI003514BF73
MSLLRTAARASVATRVIGSTHRRQQQRWAAQDAAAAGLNPPAPSEAPTPDAASSVLDQLAQLGELRAAGVLTEAEFEAQKARILSA